MPIIQQHVADTPASPPSLGPSDAASPPDQSSTGACVLAATLAAATIWLVLTDPVTVADAVSEQDITPLVRDLAAIIFEALRNLLRYL